MNMIRSLLLYLPVQVATLASGFGIVYLLTRLLGATSYGYYALVLSAMMLVQTLVLTWMEAAAYRFTPRAEARGAMGHLLHSLRDVWWRSALILWLGAVALILMVPLEAELRYAALWAASASIGNALVNMRLELWRATNKPLSYSWLKTLHLILGFAGFVLGALFIQNSAAGAFLGYAIGVFLSTLPAIWHLVKDWRKGRPQKRLQRAFFAYGWPLSVVLILDILLSAGDRFMIAALLTPADVGAYAAAYGVADKSIMALYAWAGMAASPLMIRAFDLEGRLAATAIARQAAGIFLTIGAPAALGIALVAEPLNRLMIAEDMAATASMLTPWIAAGAFFNGFVIFYLAYAFQLTRNTAKQAGCVGLAALINLGLNLALLPLFGVLGAAIATLLSYVAAGLMFWWEGRKLHAMPLPFAGAARLLPALGALALAVLLLPEAQGWLSLIGVIGVAAAAYGSACLALDVFGIRGVLVEQWRALRLKSA
jgi:O-antigen/teichoic acid export membrane protein